MLRHNKDNLSRDFHCIKRHMLFYRESKPKMRKTLDFYVARSRVPNGEFVLLFLKKEYLKFIQFRLKFLLKPHFILSS